MPKASNAVFSYCSWDLVLNFICLSLSQNRINCKLFNNKSVLPQNDGPTINVLKLFSSLWFSVSLWFSSILLITREAPSVLFSSLLFVKLLLSFKSILLTRHLSICFDKCVLLTSLLQNANFYFFIETFYTCSVHFTILIFIKICFQNITVLTSFLLLQSSHTALLAPHTASLAPHTEFPLLLTQIKHFIYLVKITKSLSRITKSIYS